MTQQERDELEALAKEWEDHKEVLYVNTLEAAARIRAILAALREREIKWAS